MGTLVTPREITVSESLCRREAVTSAIADLRLEGLAPTLRVRALFDEFIVGEMSAEKLMAAVIAP